LGREYDIIIIGAGIVGLATALEIQKVYPKAKLLILEKEGDAAMHQTGNNSGVIHSGIYYKPGSLKAKNCRDGYVLLVDYLKEKGLPFDLCGKVIVATKESEIPALEEIERRGKANGLEGIVRLDKEGIKKHEPHIAGVQGLFVPQTGICDYGQVAKSYADDLLRQGAEIHFGEAVKDWKANEIITNKGTYPYKLAINCAGLYCDKLAELRLGKLDLRIIPFRGEYYELKPDAQNLINNLVYPGSSASAFFFFFFPSPKPQT
jgi:L-2-hydroxyglutarate oxidase